MLLVADKDIDYGIRGLLTRPQALGMRAIDAQSFVHPRRDPGCAREAHTFLQQFSHQFRHALVVLDRQGSGREERSAEELAEDIRSRISASGWGNRAEVIVIDPELEVWVFATSPHVEECLGWGGHRRRLRPWLESEGLWKRGDAKPHNPKEAVDRALLQVKRPRSSAVYQCLGRRVGVSTCGDPMFRRLQGTLAGWFPAPQR